MSESAAAIGVSAGWKLFVTGLFVVLNGFFVAAEFALVKVRVSRIRTLAKSGSRPASAVLTIIEHMNLYLSSCQLGITISSLVLGWLAEPAVATLLLSGAASLGFEAGATPGLHLTALAMALAIITMCRLTG